MYVYIHKHIDTQTHTCAPKQQEKTKWELWITRPKSEVIGTGLGA